MAPTFLTELKQYLLGSISPAAWIAALLFSIVGVWISLLLDSNTRDKDSLRSPYSFNARFLIMDNIQRIILNALLILIFLRFTPELLGVKMTMITAFFVGLGFDRLGLMLRNKNILDKK